jgi:6-phosphogluconate dehydrogenase (decarboxylating)
MAGGMNLAMIGLGRMGANMARRLMRAGHEVVDCDLDRKNVDATPASVRARSTRSHVEPPGGS